MSDIRQVNEADLDWFAERDQPLTDAIRAAEAGERGLVPDSAEWWRSIAQGLSVKLYASNDALKLGLEALEGTSAIEVLEVMAIMREALK